RPAVVAVALPHERVAKSHRLPRISETGSWDSRGAQPPGGSRGPRSSSGQPSDEPFFPTGRAIFCRSSVCREVTIKGPDNRDKERIEGGNSTMASQPITRMIRSLQEGRTSAVHSLFEVYFQRLVQLARARLRSMPGLAAYDEDVALRSFESVCRRLGDTTRP